MNLKAALISSIVCLAHVAFADDVRTIHLQTNDSSEFRKVLIGFAYPETITDPNTPTIWYITRKFISKNEALMISCSTKIFSGSELLTDCSLTFNLTKSTPELAVFEGKLAGALIAKFNDSWEASKINENLSFMPLITMEKLPIKLPNGTIQSTPRVRIDCDKIPNSGGMANSCTLVALPDQASE